MLRIDKDACTITTDDGDAELANLADVLESGMFQDEHGDALATKWAATHPGDDGLATMQFDADEWDALEEAIEDAGLHIGP